MTQEQFARYKFQHSEIIIYHQKHPTIYVEMMLCAVDFDCEVFKLAPRAAVCGGHVDSMDSKVQAVETLVSKLEMHHIDITDSYNDWYRIGFALANLPNPIGRQMFHRVSAICKKYNPQECDKKFDTLQRPEKIGLGTFFHICEDYG